MSQVRTNWHIEVPVDHTDPFSKEAAPTFPQLTFEELESRLRELVEEEGRLAACGITCPIKDRPDSVCHACPLRRAMEGPLRQLCAVGLLQETAAMALATADERVRRS